MQNISTITWKAECPKSKVSTRASITVEHFGICEQTANPPVAMQITEACIVPKLSIPMEEKVRSKGRYSPFHEANSRIPEQLVTTTTFSEKLIIFQLTCQYKTTFRTKNATPSIANYFCSEPKIQCTNSSAYAEHNL